MYRCLLPAVGWLAISAVVGCGSAGPRAEEPALLDDLDGKQTTSASDGLGENNADVAVDGLDTVVDSIPRATLLQVLDAGPGAFLATVRVEPFFREQRWAGWQVSSLDAPYERAGIRTGDIVFQVNGSAIMRPEQLFKLFKELRTAESLVVTGERGGTPLELRFSILGAPSPPAPAAGSQK